MKNLLLVINFSDRQRKQTLLPKLFNLNKYRVDIVDPVEPDIAKILQREGYYYWRFYVRLTVI